MVEATDTTRPGTEVPTALASEQRAGELLRGLLTRAQLAAALGKTEWTIRRYETQGLPVRRRGNFRLYDVEETRNWLRGELKIEPRKRGRPSKNR